MRDLEDDFGFRIGSGNQAYMFDTLPKSLDKISDVKPGDLVFMSGIYYSDKSEHHFWYRALPDLLLILFN